MSVKDWDGPEVREDLKPAAVVEAEAEGVVRLPWEGRPDETWSKAQLLEHIRRLESRLVEEEARSDGYARRARETYWKDSW